MHRLLITRLRAIHCLRSNNYCATRMLREEPGAKSKRVLHCIATAYLLSPRVHTRCREQQQCRRACFHTAAESSSRATIAPHKRALVIIALSGSYHAPER